MKNTMWWRSHLHHKRLLSSKPIESVRFACNKLGDVAHHLDNGMKRAATASFSRLVLQIRQKLGHDFFFYLLFRLTQKAPFEGVALFIYLQIPQRPQWAGFYIHNTYTESSYLASHSSTSNPFSKLPCPLAASQSTRRPFCVHSSSIIAAGNRFCSNVYLCASCTYEPS